jgi:hypothetical protein
MFIYVILNERVLFLEKIYYICIMFDKYRFIIIAVLVFLLLGCLTCSIEVKPNAENGIAKNAKEVEQFGVMDNSYIIGEDKEPCRKIYGFDGLYCVPDKTLEANDILSKAESKKDCPGIGLTNSRGNLCLDENTMNLLVTRGGNRSTGPAEIGN